MSSTSIRNDMTDAPDWVDGKRIDEVRFCAEFLQSHPMVSVNSTFFTADGLVSDENLLKKELYDGIKQYVTTGIPKKVSNLLEVLRMECCTDGLPLYQDRIHEQSLYRRRAVRQRFSGP